MHRFKILLVISFLLSVGSSALAQSGCGGQFLGGTICANKTASQGIPGPTPNPVLGVPGTTLGTLGFAGNGSGTATIAAQAAAGTPSLLLPTASGTLPSTAASPLVLNAITGQLTCPTCVSGAGGALINGTTPTTGYTNTQILSSNGTVLSAYSVNGTGNVVLTTSPTLVTPVLGAAAGTSLALGGASIGSNAFAVTGTSLFNSAATFGAAITYGGVTLTNAVTGTGAMALGTSPTFTTSIRLSGISTGTATIVAQSAAGTPTLTLPNTAGTFADGASAPLVLSATTGNLTCPTCATSSGGGAITGAAPVAVSAAGVVSITGLAGGVLAGSSPAFTATPILGVAGSLQGSLSIANLTSGTAVITNATNGGNVTLQTPNTGGTIADGASSPIVLSAATGNLTCPTCATSSGGGAITGTSPVVVSAAGVVSVQGTSGAVLVGQGGTGSVFTTGPQLGSSGVAGSVTFGNATSGLVTLQPVTGALGTVTASLPANTGTIAELNLVQTFTATQTFGTISPTTINAFTLGGTIAGGGNQINNVIIGTTTPLAGSFTTLSASTSVTSPIHTASGALTFQSNGSTFAGSINTGQQWVMGTNTTAAAAPTLTVTRNTATLPAVSTLAPTIQTAAADGNGTNIALQTFGTAVFSGVRYAGARGTAATPTAIQSGDIIGGNNAYGYQTGTNAYSPGAGFFFVATENFTATNNGTRVDIYGTANGNTFPGSASASIQAGLMVGTTTDPGAGSLQLNAQEFMPNITTSSAAQTGTVCWTTGTGKFTVDTTVGCLTSIMGAKNITEHLSPSKALDIVSRLDPFAFRYKKGYGDSGHYEQFGLGAEEVAKVDERLVGRDPEGALQGVRYQEMGAVLVGAIQKLKSDNDNLREEISTIKRNHH